MVAKAPSIAVEVTYAPEKAEKKIKKTAEEIDKMGKKVKKVDGRMMKMSNSFSTAANQAAILQGPLGGTAGRLSSLATAFKIATPATLTFGVALTGLAVIMGKSVGAASRYEQELGKLNALVKTTGNVAGFTANQIDDMAISLSEATLASANEARDAAAILLSFTAIQGEQFRQTLVTAQDLTAITGNSLKSSVTQLAKALQDPTKGLNALTRSGVSFTEQQKEQIKTMSESGKRLEAQNKILGAIKAQAAGSGVGESGGVAGALDTLGERWERLLAVIGQKSGAADAATGLFTQMAKGAKVAINSLTKTAGEKAVELAQKRLQIQAELVPLFGEAPYKAQLDALSAQINALNSLRDQELAEAVKFAQKRNESRKALDDAAAIERAEKIKKEAETELLILRDKNQQIIENNLSLAGQDEQLQFVKKAAADREREEEIAKLRESKLLTDEVQNEFRIRELEEEKNHQLKLEKIREETEKKKRDKQEQTLNFGIKVADKLLKADSASGQKRKQLALQSASLLLNTKKTSAIKETVLAGQVAIAEANASAAFPYNIPAVIYAAAETAAQLATISGIAHGGLTNVPAEATYLLQKNERVISPRQNQDLTNFIQEGGGSTVNVHNYTGAPVQERRNGNNVELIIGRVKEAINNDMRRGTGVAGVMQSTYGLTRAGSV